jgi:hypothetical protein
MEVLEVQVATKARAPKLATAEQVEMEVLEVMVEMEDPDLN